MFPSVVGASGGSILTVSGSGIDTAVPLTMHLSGGGFSEDGATVSPSSVNAFKPLSPVWTYTVSADMTFLAAGLALASAEGLVVSVVDSWSDKNVTFAPARGGKKIGVVAAGPRLVWSNLECFFSVDRSNETYGNATALQNASSPLKVRILDPQPSILNPQPSTLNL